MPTSPLCACFVLLSLALIPSSARSQVPPHPTSSSPNSGPRTPRDWAVLASVNEIRAIDRSGASLRYRVRTVDSKGERLRDVVECKGGSVGRLVAMDGKGLTAEQDQAEKERLNTLAQDPNDFEHHVAEDEKAKKLARDLVRLMPDAMIYTAVPGQGATGADGAPDIVFDFAPNPAWHPPTTISEALTGLRGRVWINSRSGYVEHLHGEVFRPVNFGYGMVARVFPGGQVDLTQVDAGAGRWIYSQYTQHLRIRALLLKIIDFNLQIEASQFQQVSPQLSYQQAIALLLR